jgi:L-seryl-tRNA(Ser) seleniumtransferase
MTKKKQENGRLRRLPSIDKVLHAPEIAALIGRYGRPLVAYAARRAVATARERIGKRKGALDVTPATIAEAAEKIIRSIAEPSLKPVINATGVALHTNLGRAPMGEAVLQEIAPIIRGYSNVEFDLERAERGDRNGHVAELLRYLTGAEDAVVVNNNAAAVILVLHTLARGREVIISRGELIEIGGEFRIPDIMAAAGARMVEVGTTNRTRLSDYEKAVTSDTALIVKAHQSNFTMSGFTEEVELRDLAAFSHAKNVPFLYDIGSGLLRRPRTMQIPDEPDVQGALADGADLVVFSCDKLLGGPQAGVVAGRRDLVRALARAPLMRALRVGKLTIAALASAGRAYLDDKELPVRSSLVALLERTVAQRKALAEALACALAQHGITAQVVESFGQAGGGTLPGLKAPSFAVALIAGSTNAKQREAFAERAYHALLQGSRPVLAVLREGVLHFDVFALTNDEIAPIAERVSECLGGARTP